MLPRPVVCGGTYLVTRRCTQRQFWLRPSELTNQIIEYCIACAAKRTGVIVHAVVAMSNHTHLVVTDPEGRLPEFNEWSNKYIAKCINASYGRWENLWSPEQPSVVLLADEATIVEKLVYVLNNPVKAGLVSSWDEWPGVVSTVEELGGGVRTIERPPVFFREDGPTPKTVELEFVRAPALSHLDDQAFATLVAGLVDQDRQRHHAALAAEGRSFMGAAAILAQDPSDRPRTKEPRRRLKPRVAARDKWTRIVALEGLRDFVDRHKAAMARWLSGDRDVLFPAGTYAMRVRHHVAVPLTG